jgi:DNA-binding FadR family transcriptional regulator
MSSPKLAPVVADRIVADVIDRRWPVGQVLGSESDLLARYGVSRAVFREAVRLVEHQHVARMRRGPGGGLVVTEPTVATVTDATVLYLYRVGARLDEVFGARLAVEDLAAQLASRRLDEDGVIRLRAVVRAEADGPMSDHRALHALVAAATGNPAIELFVDLLHDVQLLYFADAADLPARTLAEAAVAHARLADAVVGGDEGLARHRMRRHLDAEAAVLRRRRSTRQLLDPATAIKGDGGAKRAEQVARQVFRDIVARRLVPGDVIGSELDLMARHGVSRAVLREAVRLLEHHHVAVMRRGTGGGLFVAAPDAEAVTDVVALYLERRGIRYAEIVELRRAVEVALVDPVVDRLDAAARQQLQVVLDAEVGAPDDEFTDAARDVHGVIAGLSGNRVLALLALVLIRLSRRHELARASTSLRRQVGADVAHAHRAIVAALIAGDRDLARHRVQRHLDALAAFVS